MIEILRDPVWNSISAIVAIVALIYALYQDKNKQLPNIKKISMSIGRILLGTLVFFLGPPLEFTITNLFKGGLPEVIAVWQSVASSEVLDANLTRYLFFSLFVGSIVVSAIPKNFDKSQNILLRTIIVSIIALWTADIILFVLKQIFTPLILSIFSDILGGFIGGLITLQLVKIYDNIFYSKDSTG